MTQHDIDVIFRSYGLVSIASVDPSVGVLLKYATDDNFMKKNLYGDLKDAYFVQEIAERIAYAQKMLRDDFPSFSLLVYDAARPMSIQRQMFETVEGTDKEIYVASPYSGGGYHNYGLAVDLTIVDDKGKVLDMGSDFDCFDEISHVGNEELLVATGRISAQAKENRDLLLKCMSAAGFEQNPTEWWHFQRYSKEYMRENFSLLDF